MPSILVQVVLGIQAILDNNSSLCQGLTSEGIKTGLSPSDRSQGRVM